jgi:hypothetical protein
LKREVVALWCGSRIKCSKEGIGLKGYSCARSHEQSDAFIYKNLMKEMCAIVQKKLLKIKIMVLRRALFQTFTFLNEA